MTETIENLCYEFSDDVLFSQESSFSGAPVCIIVYVQSKYSCDLGEFLENHGYRMVSRKNEGRHFSLVKFELINLSYYDNLHRGDSLKDEE